MYIENEKFEVWMERIMERFDKMENRSEKEQKEEIHRIDGERLFDNQDLCLLLKVSKRTLQRYRSSGMLKYKHIGQKIYYIESEVHRFVREHMK